MIYFERSDCAITVHSDLYYNELILNLNKTQKRCHVKSKKFKVGKIQIRLIKACELRSYELLLLL